MNLEKVKEKVGDEMFAELKTYLDDIVGQRDTARDESIKGRKQLKEKVASLESATTALMEKLGIESIEQIDSLPDAKGAAEAAKQYETKLKRMERQLSEAVQARDEANQKYRTSQARAVLSEAIGKHDFIDRELVESFINSRVVWDNDELLFKTEDGRLVPVNDGVSGFAKSNPKRLKSHGTGGAGVRQSNAGSGGSGSRPTITRAEFESLDPAARSKAASEMTITD